VVGVKLVYDENETVAPSDEISGSNALLHLHDAISGRCPAIAGCGVRRARSKGASARPNVRGLRPSRCEDCQGIDRKIVLLQPRGYWQRLRPRCPAERSSTLGAMNDARWKTSFRGFKRRQTRSVERKYNSDQYPFFLLSSWQTDILSLEYVSCPQRPIVQVTARLCLS
jgi:hypothetical protein